MPRVGYQPIVDVAGVGNDDDHHRPSPIHYPQQNQPPPPSPFARQYSNEAHHPTTFYPDEVLVNIGGENNGGGGGGIDANQSRPNRNQKNQRMSTEHASETNGANGDDQYQNASSMIGGGGGAAATTSRWRHQDNLDDFFARVYEYHQRHGFVCMLLSDCFELFQFVFVVAFSSFLLECVDYRILFKEAMPKNFNASQVPARKLTLSDSIRADCASRFPGWLIVCLMLAAAFWLHRLVRVIYRTTRTWEMRQFFEQVLSIRDCELENLTWHEVQRRLRDAQPDHQFCIHKRELTELDIYQRILRRKNYFVAMVNKGLLPPKLHLPLLGEHVNFVIFTNFFKFNLELIYFESYIPWSSWENHWHLKADYKRRDKRQELTERTRRVLLWLGISNLIFSPIMIVWQILYSFFFYAELIKREPGSLGARRWSIFGRYYFRHFNELDHELDARLCRAYRPAQYYMDMFISSIGEVLAKNVAFFAGALFAVLVILSVYDEDVLQVEHVLTAITGLGLVIAVCKVFIPDENLVWCPEMMMSGILSQVHYMPDNWRGQGHTEQIRSEFSQLFQYKATFLMEELLSPLITPFVLLFWLRPRTSEFIDFFRKFTVEVPGLGDVCSFAQMDVHKHGDPCWQPTTAAAAARGPKHQPPTGPREPDDARVPADYGKTEMSLIHFAITNPEWEPTTTRAGGGGGGGGSTQRFLNTFRREVHKDVQTIRDQQAAGTFDNALLQSLAPLGMPPSFGLLGGVHSIFSGVPSMPGATARAPELKGRGVSKSEGPLYASIGVGSGIIGSTSNSATGISQHQQQPYQPSLSSVLMSSRFIAAAQNLNNAQSSMAPTPTSAIFGGGLAESTAAEMSMNALYMHEIHRRRVAGRNYGATFDTAAVNAAFARAATHDEEDEENEMGVDAGQSDLWNVPRLQEPPSAAAAAAATPSSSSSSADVFPAGQHHPAPMQQILRLHSQDDEDEDEAAPHCFDSTS